MKNAYIDIRTSLLKFCKDIVKSSPEFSKYEVFDFDAHGSIHELPPAPLVGIGEYSITKEGNSLYTTVVSFVVATQSDDSQLVNLTTMINKLFDSLEIGDTGIPVVDTDGVPRGNLVVMENVNVMAVARADTRPVQMINVMFGSALR